MPVLRPLALPSMLTRRGLFVAAATLTTAASKAGETTASDFRLSLPPLEADYRRLYLIRHGETNWNLESRVQGRTDNPLNANGVAQATALADALASEPIQLVVSSTLARASATADAVVARHPNARRTKSESFVEMCFGENEGKLLSEFDVDYQQFLRRWRAGENALRFPGAGGESPQDVADRGLAGLQSLGLVGATPAAERHICIVAHGRFNKILIAALQGDVSTASDVKQGNTCINVLDIKSDGGCIVRALDVRGHLREQRPVPT